MGAVIVASRYVPRPPDDNLWNFWKANLNGVGTPYMPVGGGFPFINKRFAFNYDDAAVWYRNGSSFSALRLPAVTVLPFSNKRWAANYDDAPAWQNKSTPVPRVNALVNGNFPFKPTFRTSYDEPAVFYGRTLDVPIQLLPTGSTAPFAPSRWKFDYDQSSEWAGRSGSAFWVLDQSFQLFVPTTTKQIPPGDEQNWAGNKTQVNNLLLGSQVVVTPLAPSRWKYDNDESAVWYSKPGAIPDNYLPVGGGFPFVPVRWRLDNDDAAVWSGGPSPAAVLRLPSAAAPFLPVRWKFDYDDASFWARQPRSSQTLLIAPLPTFFGAVGQAPSHRWNFDYVPPTEWVGKPFNGYSVNQPIPAVPTLSKVRQRLFMSNVGRLMN